MKVIATKPGFLGKYRHAGDTFEVPDGAKATWFEPLEPKVSPAGKQPKAKPADEPPPV